MPVVYRCQACGQTHPAPVLWDSQDEFDALPRNFEVGSWGCPDRPWWREQAYLRADLFWVNDYTTTDWDDLQRLLAAARDAVRRGRPGYESRLREVEGEVAARRFRVVARYPSKRVVWAAYRTRAECQAHLKREGVREGVGHKYRGARFEVVIEEPD